MTNPRVFISFAHESDEHRAAVKALADWLVDHGVEAITDHPHGDRPADIGWQAWMLAKRRSDGSPSRSIGIGDCPCMPDPAPNA